MIAEKKWILSRESASEKTQELASGLDIPPVLANLLTQRGIDSLEAAKRFFNPLLEELHDPFLMKDMDRAVIRVREAIERGEKVMVYGDYDVDGTTAVALIYTFLSSIGAKNLLFYIPDRYTEGYGISSRGIDYAASQNVNLIIALDCGIKAIDRVDYAASMGIDFIICDHHLPGDEIPRAVAVLDPRRTDCGYPFKELSGCGVGYKLSEAYARRYNIDKSLVESLLDYVAVSIASDIVPLTGENRILAYYGLERLNSNPSKGLGSIIKICGLEKHRITIDEIVFKIGPRINAAGRMVSESEDGSVISGGGNAVRLLISTTEEKALKYGNIIDTCNTDRKEIDRTITSEARRIVESTPGYETSKCTVIYNPEWIKGVVGIVASRLIESYYRPTVVLTMSNGFITGSARSVPGFDLYQAIESCSDLMENFGGHTYAAGMTMKPENLDEFKRRFEAYVEEHIDPEMLIPQIEIDSYLSLDEITPRFRQILSRFQPFGPGNPAPTFRTDSVNDYGHGRRVGGSLEHLKMDIVGGGSTSPISAIAFSQARHASHILDGGSFDICYSVVENSYRGEVKPQLRIKDIKQRK
ncbi:MAG: single-stranded-DNA-specific exonuclease RecJ [Rikenellaceae bacterium]|nr:single-stranded-DNA-specific exonuclease RecJ [Rikenellaceae bacterium]MDE7355303.1 single-stranded-DNA-specific exonuclease RecJ [Rikenellaceae bacterium]